ncbi:MAG: YIP1 family protein [Rhodobacteraceae bacterium]|nr:YIP1 family protein [Paracoccaceae bacterium]
MPARGRTFARGGGCGVSAEICSMGNLLRMTRETVSNPREGAAQILALGLSGQALHIAFGLVIILSMLLGEIVVLISPPAPPEALNISPVSLGVVQAAFLFVIAHAITRIGQWFGGTGQYTGALALIVWLQFIFLVVQLVQLAAMLIIPPLAGLIGLASVGLFFWLLTNFVAEVHGFRNLWRVFLGLVLGLMVFGMALFAVLLALLTSVGGAA